MEEGAVELGVCLTARGNGAWSDPLARHPDGVLESVRALEFVCPVCRGELEAGEGAYHCDPCARTYPVQAGIPDFRVFPDPYLNFAQDRERAERILERFEELSFEPLLAHYWSLSDITPPSLRKKFIESVRRGEGRGAQFVESWFDGTYPVCVDPQRMLEIGCGTGSLLAAAQGRFQTVVGADIAMRWLQMARRRFRDLGVECPAMVCCCAEAMPFADGTFSVVASRTTLEFAREPRRMLSEAARVLTADGVKFVQTTNRHSLATNPFCDLWGVGWLPRAWQAGYVAWRRGATYGPIRQLSAEEMLRIADERFERVDVRLPEVEPGELDRAGRFMRVAGRIYRAAKRIPTGRWALRRVTPEWVGAMWGRKTPERSLKMGVSCSAAPPGGVRPPLATVVVPSVNGGDELWECLQELARQCGKLGAELIVVDCVGSTLRGEIAARFPGVRVVPVEGRKSLPELRGIGVAHARGEVVAMTEDHCVVGEGWLRTVVELRGRGHLAMGGTIENGCRGRSVDWAVYFCEYSRFLPRAAGATDLLPANNWAFDRTTLTGLMTSNGRDAWETVLLQKLRESGVTLHHDPRLAVIHRHSCGVWEALGQRFHYSRTFAGTRLKCAAGWKRWLYAAATPALIPLLAARNVAGMVKHPREWGRYLRAWPMMLVLYVVWAAGEGVGAVSGPGESPLQVR